MHVGAAGERVDQARVLGEVGEDPQLDLRVVGGEQPAAVVGDERPPHLAPVGGAHRDVLQVRFSLEMRPVVVAVWLNVGVDAPVGAR